MRLIGHGTHVSVTIISFGSLKNVWIASWNGCHIAFGIPLYPGAHFIIDYSLYTCIYCISKKV